MRKLVGMALAASALMVLSGCERATQQPAAADAASVEKQLKDSEAAWNAEYNSRNVEAIIGHYADDAALANPGAPLATDAASRRAAITQFVSDPNLHIEFASDRVQVAKSGDLAYTRGHFSMRTTDPATKQPRTDTGTYLTVWQKQADGSWKAVEDAVVPGAPAPAADAAG